MQFKRIIVTDLALWKKINKLTQKIVNPTTFFTQFLEPASKFTRKKNFSKKWTKKPKLLNAIWKTAIFLGTTFKQNLLFESSYQINNSFTSFGILSQNCNQSLFKNFGLSGNKHF